MTFTFTMDAFPDYTKFDRTHKVLAAIQVIQDQYDEEEEVRQPCVIQDVVSLTDGVTVTFDNDSTDAYCKLTVTGYDVDGTTYDQDWWGDKLNNAAELEIIMPIDENGSYRLVTQNPMLKHYPEDAELKNGVWTKDKVYEIDDGSLTLRTVVTDDKGAILIKLFKIDADTQKESLVKTFSINNKVTFKKKTATTTPPTEDDNV